jgi:hypothetical protein
MDAIETIIALTKFIETLQPDSYEHRVIARTLANFYAFLEKGLNDVEPPPPPPPFKLHT